MDEKYGEGSIIFVGKAIEYNDSIESAKNVPKHDIII
jgi:hypothetical protein